MTPDRPEGRGRRALTSTAFAALIVTGLSLLVWAFAHQVGIPPSPLPNEGVAAAAEQTTPSVTPSPTQPSPPSATPLRAGRSDTTSKSTKAAAPSTAGPSPTTAAPAPTTPKPSVPPLPRSKPVAVRIPAIDVDSPLQPLGLDKTGALEVPTGERYNEAAWYDGSPTPGEVGPAVIEGHVTSQGSVPSVFFDLGALRRGDTIEVERADGTTATFEVYAANSFPKDSFPKVEVYGNTTDAELRVITCGGVYDPAEHRHLDNIVIFARLVPTD